jgi:hypothetical protein
MKAVLAVASRQKWLDWERNGANSRRSGAFEAASSCWRARAHIPEFNTRITLQRLARGGYVIARAGLELVNYRITQRGKEAIIEHDLN